MGKLGVLFFLLFFFLGGCEKNFILENVSANFSDGGLNESVGKGGVTPGFNTSSLGNTSVLSGEGARLEDVYLLTNNNTLENSFEVRLSSLDIDGDGNVDFETDGRLIEFSLLGFQENLFPNISSNTSRSRAEVLLYLAELKNSTFFDVDGNGSVDFFSDGILLQRYLKGTTDSQLVRGVSSNAKRNTSEEIVAYLNCLNFSSNYKYCLRQNLTFQRPKFTLIVGFYDDVGIAEELSALEAMKRFIEMNSDFEIEYDVYNITEAHTYTSYNCDSSLCYVLGQNDISESAMLSLPKGDFYLFFYKDYGKRPLNAGSTWGPDYGIDHSDTRHAFAVIPTDEWWWEHDEQNEENSLPMRIITHEAINLIGTYIQASFPVECMGGTDPDENLVGLEYEASRFNGISEVCYGSVLSENLAGHSAPAKLSPETEINASSLSFKWTYSRDAQEYYLIVGNVSDKGVYFNASLQKLLGANTLITSFENLNILEVELRTKINGEWNSEIYSFPLNLSSSLDIDGDGRVTEEYDAFLIFRYLFDLREDVDEINLGDAPSRTPEEIKLYLEELGSAYILDIDGDGSMDSLSDGVLIVRYMNGLSGPELVEGAVGLNSLRSEPMNILKYLDCINTTLEFNICKGLYLDSVVKSSLDIDGDGNVRAASDGMLLQRFLFGFTDNSLFEGDVVGENSTRGTKQILLYLSDLFLSEILDINADGKIDALSDGVLISRYMMGFLGLNLTEGVNGVDAQRFTPDKIVEYLDCLNTTPDFESCKGLYLDT